MNHLRIPRLALLLPACLLLALSGPAMPADAKDDTIHLFKGQCYFKFLRPFTGHIIKRCRYGSAFVVREPVIIHNLFHRYNF